MQDNSTPHRRRTVTTTIPSPIAVRKTSLDALPGHYAEAADKASCHISFAGNEPVRIETYDTQDIRRLVEETWGWSCTIHALKNPKYDKAKDVERTQVIVDLLKAGEPQWPYVSYWADDIEQLAETQDDDGEISV